MIIPTLGCPSKCKYCWSSEEGSPVMSIDTVKEIVAWLKNFRSDRVTFTFHGGEPLLAGADFYRQALPLLAGELAELTPDFAMQTNLWRMTPEIACRACGVPCPPRVEHRRPGGDHRFAAGRRVFCKVHEGLRDCPGCRPAGAVHLHVHEQVGEAPGGDLQFFQGEGVCLKTPPGPALAPLGEPEGVGAGAGGIWRPAGLSPRQVA